MAKQNVTFIERHAEKFVIGICGAVLLVTAYLYGVGTPHAVEVSGEPAGPSQFYGTFKTAADNALSQMRGARYNPDQAADPAQDAGPKLPAARPPTEFAVTIVPPGPPIPEITGSPPDAVALVDIIAPTRPIVTTGSSSAQLAPMQQVQGAFDPPAPDMANIPTADVFWASVFFGVEGKKQRQIYEAARYDARRQTLLVTRVEAERQERLPTGEWGPSEVVQGYAPVQYLPQAELQLVPNEGQLQTPPEVMEYINQFRGKIQMPEQQDRILRPPFQAFLTNAYQWIPPKRIEIPGMPAIDLTEGWGVAFEPETDNRPGPRRPTGVNQPPNTMIRGEMGRAPGMDFEGPVGGRQPLPQPMNPAAGDNPGMLVNTAIKEAQQQIDKKEFLKAEEILRQAQLIPNLPKPFSDKLQAMLDQHASEFEAARKEVVERERIKQAKQTLGIGYDVEPGWVNDISVRPGATYRYRVRLVAINQYAGMPSYLQNPEDAAKLVVAGKWSEWSEPITVKADKKLFVTSVKEDQSVRLEIHQWADGKWNAPEVLELALGQPVVTAGKRPFDYGAVLADVDLHRAHADRQVRRDGRITWSADKETQAVTLIHADGSVEERLVARDVSEKRKFNEDKDKERTQLALGRPMIEQRQFGSTPMMPGPGGFEGPMGPGMRGYRRGPMEEP